MQTWTKFRKKPIVTEAVQFTGFVIEAVQFTGYNSGEIINFTNHTVTVSTKEELIINTLEGNMSISPRDWVIKGISGEYYLCKPDIFEKTYERV